MALFTVRVVLHNVKNLDHSAYARLHTAMGKAHFYNVIQGSNGVSYHLPPAEYRCSGNISIEDVRAEASSIAKLIDADSGVLVTEGGAAWTGLKKVS